MDQLDIIERGDGLTFEWTAAGSPWVVVAGVSVDKPRNTSGIFRPLDVFMGSDDEQVYVIGSDNSLLMVDPEGVVQRVEAIPEFPLFGVAVAVAATD